MSNGNQVTQVAVNSLPFWSRIIVPFDLRWNGTQCQRRVITRGTKIRAFGYRQNEANVRALNGASATERDTIVQEGGKTRGGARYVIFGLSIGIDAWPYTASDNEGLIHEMWPPMSQQPCNQASGPLAMTVEDYRSLLATFANAFAGAFKVDIKVDGTKRTLEMGIPAFYPGMGGIKDQLSAMNGDVFVANFMPIPETIMWNPAGAVDSNLAVQLEAAYDVDLPTWTTPTGTINGEPVSQDNPIIEGAVPTAIGREWQQAFMINFHGREESPVSNVS